jgi:hypothetical protein
MQRTAKILLGLALVLTPGPAARAGEADDLQRMIEVARQGADYLTRLDEHQAVRDELALLDEWLKGAWRLRAQQKYDEVRVVLDRVQAQSDMIREKITAAQLDHEASKREAELRRIRDEIAKTKQALQTATLQKAALEGRTK